MTNTITINEAAWNLLDWIDERATGDVLPDVFRTHVTAVANRVFHAWIQAPGTAQDADRDAVAALCEAFGEDFDRAVRYHGVAAEQGQVGLVWLNTPKMNLPLLRVALRLLAKRAPVETQTEPQEPTRPLPPQEGGAPGEYLDGQATQELIKDPTISNRAIAKRLGVPRSQIDRLAKDKESAFHRATQARTKSDKGAIPRGHLDRGKDGSITMEAAASDIERCAGCCYEYNDEHLDQDGFCKDCQQARK